MSQKGKRKQILDYDVKPGYGILVNLTIQGFWTEACLRKNASVSWLKNLRKNFKNV